MYTVVVIQRVDRDLPKTPQKNLMDGGHTEINLIFMIFVSIKAEFDVVLLYNLKIIVYDKIFEST